jgi:predicted RNase H-like nuclease (RuvC/YqgF family)
LQWQESLIHVIEYSYAKKLEEHNKQLRKDIWKLVEENKRLREALEFYANEMNYSVDDYRGISGEMIRRCVLNKDLEERNDVYSYAGMRARQALYGETKECV